MEIATYRCTMVGKRKLISTKNLIMSRICYHGTKGLITINKICRYNNLTSHPSCYMYKIYPM